MPMIAVHWGTILLLLLCWAFIYLFMQRNPHPAKRKEIHNGNQINRLLKDEERKEEKKEEKKLREGGRDL